MRKLCYIFVAYKQRLWIVSYENEGFVPMKKEGEVIKLVDFKLSWWKDQAAYEEYCELDFCLIWEGEKPSVFDDPFLPCFREDSVWNMPLIMRALDELDIREYRLINERGDCLKDGRGDELKTNARWVKTQSPFKRKDSFKDTTHRIRERFEKQGWLLS